MGTEQLELSTARGGQTRCREERGFSWQVEMEMEMHIAPKEEK